VNAAADETVSHHGQIEDARREFDAPLRKVTLEQLGVARTNIALDSDGNIYWTCKSAGVILERDEEAGVTRTLLAGLARPTGIAVDRRGKVYFTEVPTPGVAGGSNRVVVSDAGALRVLHAGEPEPTDIVVSKKGKICWTCKSAGVIVEASPVRGQ
jgi:streptogramin lyase